MKILSAFWRVIKKEWKQFWTRVRQDKQFWENRWQCAKVHHEMEQARQAEKAECTHHRSDGTSALVLFNDLSGCGNCGRAAICQRCQTVTKDPLLLEGLKFSQFSTSVFDRKRTPEEQALYDMPLAELRKLITGKQ